MGIFTKAVTTIARGLGLTSPELYQYFGVGETDSGETVSVDGSLQIGTVWACVGLLAETIATLPISVYRNDANGHGIAQPDHPLSRLLRLRPNADMTAVDFWTAVVSALQLWGNVYVGVTRFSARIVALNPMRPDRMTIRRETDGTLTYTYNWMGQTQTFSEDEVLHIKGFSLDGLLGISPISVARNTLGASRAAERASSSIFKNGMRPSGVITAPEYLTDVQRSDAKVKMEAFRGAMNTGGVPLMEGGWKFESLSIPPEDAQMLQTRQFHVEEICRWFRVPPVMIGHMEKQTSWGTGVEATILQWYAMGLRKELKRLETAVNAGLLTPAEEAAGYYVEFNIEGLLRADSAGRASYYSTMVQNGMMTRNEARALENLPRKDGGDDLTVQSNLIPASDLGIIARMPREKPVEPGAAISPPTPGSQPSAPSPQNGSSAVAPIKQ